MDRTAILRAVDALFDRELEFLTELVRHPSTRGPSNRHRMSWRVTCLVSVMRSTAGKSM